MTKLLFVFLDGVGLGSRDADINPFITARTPFLESLLGDKLSASLVEQQAENFVFRHLDTTLSVPGLPQSATGQAALLTGHNAAQHMGRHYGPWPGPSIWHLLDQGSLFSEVVEASMMNTAAATLANVYPPGYFAALQTGKHKVNVPVYAAQAAGLSLRSVEDYRLGQAVSVDLRGSYLQRYGAGVSSPELEAERLAALAHTHQFTFFDMWQTDSIGHRGSFAEAVALIEDIDRFLGKLAETQDLTIVITSDHGNLENKQVKTHTMAQVPLIVLGSGAEPFRTATSLLDIAPAIRQCLVPIPVLS